jgi:hypothetical protein
MVLRIEKGSELTHQEMDDNFSELKNKTLTLDAKIDNEISTLGDKVNTNVTDISDLNDRLNNLSTPTSTGISVMHLESMVEEDGLHYKIAEFEKSEFADEYNRTNNAMYIVKYDFTIFGNDWQSGASAKVYRSFSGQVRGEMDNQQADYASLLEGRPSEYNVYAMRGVDVNGNPIASQGDDGFSIEYKEDETTVQLFIKPNDGVPLEGSYNSEFSDSGVSSFFSVVKMEEITDNDNWIDGSDY